MFRSSGVICNQELASAYLESREGKAGRWLSATPGEADLGCDGITIRRRSDEGTEVDQWTSLNCPSMFSADVGCQRKRLWSVRRIPWML